MGKEVDVVAPAVSKRCIDIFLRLLLPIHDYRYWGKSHIFINLFFFGKMYGNLSMLETLEPLWKYDFMLPLLWEIMSWSIHCTFPSHGSTSCREHPTDPREAHNCPHIDKMLHQQLHKWASSSQKSSQSSVFRSLAQISSTFWAAVYIE